MENNKKETDGFLQGLRTDYICKWASDKATEIIGEPCSSVIGYNVESLRNFLSVQYEGMDCSVLLGSEEYNMSEEDFVNRVLTPMCCRLKEHILKKKHKATRYVCPKCQAHSGTMKVIDSAYFPTLDDITLRPEIVDIDMHKERLLCPCGNVNTWFSLQREILVPFGKI